MRRPRRSGPREGRVRPLAGSPPRYLALAFPPGSALEAVPLRESLLRVCQNVAEREGLLERLQGADTRTTDGTRGTPDLLTKAWALVERTESGGAAPSAPEHGDRGGEAGAPTPSLGSRAGGPLFQTSSLQQVMVQAVKAALGRGRMTPGSERGRGPGAGRGWKGAMRRPVRDVLASGFGDGWLGGGTRGGGGGSAGPYADLTSFHAGPWSCVPGMPGVVLRAAVSPAHEIARSPAWAALHRHVGDALLLRLFARARAVLVPSPRGNFLQVSGEPLWLLLDGASGDGTGRGRGSESSPATPSPEPEPARSLAREGSAGHPTAAAVTLPAAAAATAAVALPAAASRPPQPGAGDRGRLPDVGGSRPLRAPSWRRRKAAAARARAASAAGEEALTAPPTANEWPWPMRSAGQADPGASRVPPPAPPVPRRTAGPPDLPTQTSSAPVHPAEEGRQPGQPLHELEAMAVREGNGSATGPASTGPSATPPAYASDTSDRGLTPIPLTGPSADFLSPSVARATQLLPRPPPAPHTLARPPPGAGPLPPHAAATPSWPCHTSVTQPSPALSPLTQPSPLSLPLTQPSHLPELATWRARATAGLEAPTPAFRPTQVLGSDHSPGLASGADPLSPSFAPSLCGSAPTPPEEGASGSPEGQDSPAPPRGRAERSPEARPSEPDGASDGEIEVEIGQRGAPRARVAARRGRRAASARRARPSLPDPSGDRIPRHRILHGDSFGQLPGFPRRHILEVARQHPRGSEVLFWSLSLHPTAKTGDGAVAESDAAARGRAGRSARPVALGSDVGRPERAERCEGTGAGTPTAAGSTGRGAGAAAPGPIPGASGALRDPPAPSHLPPAALAALPALAQVIRRHARCSYGALLERCCPLPERNEGAGASSAARARVEARAFQAEAAAREGALLDLLWERDRTCSGAGGEAEVGPPPKRPKLDGDGAPDATRHGGSPQARPALPSGATLPATSTLLRDSPPLRSLELPEGVLGEGGGWPAEIEGPSDEERRSGQQAALRSRAPSLPPLSSQAVPHARVAAFCWAALRRVLPASLRGGGTRDGPRRLRAAVRRFVDLRRHEDAVVGDLLRGLGPRHFPGLFGAAPDAGRGRPPGTDSRARLLTVACWVRWIFASFVTPLLRASFYASEGEGNRYHVLFFRRPLWVEACRKAEEAALREGHLARVSPARAAAVLRSGRSLGASVLRAVPKGPGARLIATLSKAARPPPPARAAAAPARRTAAAGGRAPPHRLPPVNWPLRRAAATLEAALRARPGALGAAVRGPADAFCAAKPALLRLREGSRAGAGRPAGADGARTEGSGSAEERGDAEGSCARGFFVVTMDVEKAFDRIRADELLAAVARLLDSPTYDVASFVALRARGGARGTAGAAARPGAQPRSLLERSRTRQVAHAGAAGPGATAAPLSTRLADARPGGPGRILVPEGGGGRVGRETSLMALSALARGSLLRARSGWVLQTTGIPQGSCVSGLLCALYLGLVEEEAARAGPPSAARPFLLRNVDDFLLVTSRAEDARAAARALGAALDAYGVPANAAKTRSSFDIGDTRLRPGSAAPQGARSSSLIPWCGTLLSAETLEFSGDYSSYVGRPLRPTMNLPSGPGASRGLALRVASYLRPKLTFLLLDGELNSPLTVRRNAYQALLLAAMKFHCYLRSLAVPPLAAAAASLAAASVDACAREMASLVRPRTVRPRRGDLRPVPYKPRLPSSHVRFLTLRAFQRALARKPARHAVSLPWLAAEAARAEASLAPAARRLLEMAACPAAHTDFDAIHY